MTMAPSALSSYVALLALASSSAFSPSVLTAQSASNIRLQLSSTVPAEPATNTSPTAAASTTNGSSATTAKKSKSPIFEFLKFDSNPTFDVIQKTKDYIALTQGKDGIPPGSYEDIYDERYVLRGPVIGPINRSDLALSQNGLGIRSAFPNVEIDTFGYTIDPENPYRCFYFQRWRAVMEGDLDSYGDIYPANNKEAEMPVSVFSVVWTPEGKIIYEQVGAVVDRFEGNTEGKAAVFGLLHHAGLKLNANPGDAVFAFIQRLGHVIGGMGRSWSKKGEVPSWWVSKSKGADATDQW